MTKAPGLQSKLIAASGLIDTLVTLLVSSSQATGLTGIWLLTHSQCHFVYFSIKWRRHTLLKQVSPLCRGTEEASADSKRWVPTSADLPGLEGTPAERLQYDAPDGCQQRDYRCAAIAHYSLFDAFHRARFKARAKSAAPLSAVITACFPVLQSRSTSTATSIRRIKIEPCPSHTSLVHVC